MTAAKPSGMECPQCHQLDQVRKVSAIVKSSTTTGALTGTSTGDSGDASHILSRDSQTVLSKLLASPKKPRGSGWPRWQQVPLYVFVAVMASLIVGLVIAQAVLEHSSGNQDPLYAITVQLLFVGFAGGVIGLIVLLGNGNRRYKKLRQKWKETYYCQRCDGFFIPDKTKLIAPEAMQDWLRACKWKK